MKNCEKIVLTNSELSDNKNEFLWKDQGYISTSANFVKQAVNCKNNELLL